jgi:hypothetical protein
MVKIWNAVLYERHPTVLIFFFLLLSVGEILYLPTVWPQINGWQKTFAVIAIVCPYMTLYLATGDPGYISADNVQHYMNLYPYDYSIFHPGQECRTCRILKPARSKHCSLCKRCVARSDHHCVFINQCVGYRNHRWFVLLLLSTAVLTSYGSMLGISLLSAKIKSRFLDWSLWPPRGMGWERYFALWGWSLQSSVGMGAVTLLTFLISPMVWAFFVYTVYMLYCGMTTNESLKWSEWKDEVRDGTAYRRSMSVGRIKDPRFEGPTSRWPNDTEQILITTETGGPPKNPNIPGHGLWEQVRSFGSIHNLYDLGLWNNIVDVFVPNHRFGRGRLPDNTNRIQKRAVVGSAW